MSRAQHLEEAAEHARKGRWNKAIEAYRAVLAEEPDNVDLRVVLAEAYKRIKNDERAFHHYHRAGVLLLSKGEAMRAAAALAEANAVGPGQPDVLWRLCEALKSAGRAEDLVPYLVALIRAAGAPGDRRRLWALEELFLLHPDDLSVAQQRAEALFEADRIDESVLAYKKLAARLHTREAELVQVLFRAAKIAEGRPDLGADLASVLLAHGRAKDALAVIVGFYEKAPDNLAVLETLVRSLEGMGAGEKALAARVELVKARAAGGSRSQVVAEVDGLLAVAPEDPVALEVAAHALAMVREPARALDCWRRLLRVADRRGQKAERDRALAAVLKANPDDEEALELGVQVHAQAARFNESDALRQRLAAVRALKKRALMAAPAQLHTPAPSNKRGSSPPVSQSPLGAAAGLPEDPDPESTMMLSDADVLAVRGSEREHDPVPERSDATPRPQVTPPERADTLRPIPNAVTQPPKARPAPLDPFASPLSSNPWFDGRERRAPSNPGRARVPPTVEVASGLRERQSTFPDPASLGAGDVTRADGGDMSSTRTDETPLPRRKATAASSAAATRRRQTPARPTDTAPVALADADEMTWEADEPTTMDTRAVQQLRVLTDAVAISDLGGPALPGELTHPGFSTQPAALPDIVDDLDEP